MNISLDLLIGTADLDEMIYLKYHLLILFEEVRFSGALVNTSIFSSRGYLGRFKL